jgi:putative transposase
MAYVSNGERCMPAAELLNRLSFKTKAKAKLAAFEFIKGWYNPSRRHSALGYM